MPKPFLNVDLVKSEGVDIVADAEILPFRTESIAAIECDAVLEHVGNPSQAVQEFFRVLRPGGFLHVVVPFCHPFHAYPFDYQRWSLHGLRALLSNFEPMEVGVRTGPTATLLTFLLEYIKLLAPRALRKPIYALFGWLVWPARYLDRWLNRKPEAQTLANHIYALVRKPCTKLNDINL